MVIRYIIVSLVSGVAFGILDGVINANPLAASLFEAYKPIAKEQVNAIFGIAADLVYGFVLAGLFILLYDSLPGTSGLVKGLSFGAIAWFFRVAMSAASTLVMYKVPLSTILYQLGTGLAEMLIIGVILGLALAKS
jgi:hypothetical protein